MKKLMIILAILLAASSAYAQGTVPGPSPDWKRYEARPVAPAKPAEAIRQTSLEVGDTFWLTTKTEEQAWSCGSLEDLRALRARARTYNPSARPEVPSAGCGTVPSLQGYKVVEKSDDAVCITGHPPYSNARPCGWAVFTPDTIGPLAVAKSTRPERPVGVVEFSSSVISCSEIAGAVRHHRNRLIATNEACVVVPKGEVLVWDMHDTAYGRALCTSSMKYLNNPPEPSQPICWWSISAASSQKPKPALAAEDDPDDVLVQNAALVTLAKDGCGYRIKAKYAQSIRILKDNAKVTAWRIAFAAELVKRDGSDLTRFCREMRTDALAKFLDF